MLVRVSANNAECPEMAEAVEKLRSEKRRRNKGIGGSASTNHCCAVRPANESMLRPKPLKIVFQQPRLEATLDGHAEESPLFCTQRI
jgi:hypothetical protein